MSIATAALMASRVLGKVDHGVSGDSGILLFEKDAVSLAANHGEEFSRGVRVLRLELESVLFRGPPDGGACCHERTVEPLRRIPNLRRVEEATPLDVERNPRADGLDGIDVRIGKTQVTGKP